MDDSDVWLGHLDFLLADQIGEVVFFVAALEHHVDARFRQSWCDGTIIFGQSRLWRQIGELLVTLVEDCTVSLHLSHIQWLGPNLNLKYFFCRCTLLSWLQLPP